MDMRNTHKILVGKREGKRPLGIRRYRWEDNIKMDIGEIMWESVGRIHLVQERDH
jgi:hypothetical protein